jgi:ribosomal protein S4
LDLKLKLLENLVRQFTETIKTSKKKNQPPGQHGPNKRRGAKKSEYATQLAEKQKAKYTYGILERQFANLFDKAHRSKGVTGEVLFNFANQDWIT